MMGRRDTYALKVKGESMRDEGILPGDLVIVQKQSTA
jgi:repressor LexA